MRLRLFGAVFAFAALLLSARHASAQSLASIAAANAATTAVEKAGAGCWGCGSLNGHPMCLGGQVPGYYNCMSTVAQGCNLSSPGCGGGSALPIDPDGSTQYVSRGSLLAVQVVFHEGDPP